MRTIVSGEGLNYLNIFLIAVSLGLAYLIPFELLLFAYAFLGPAHYLTEISWLHDRNYFVSTGKAWALMFIGLALTVLAIYVNSFGIFVAAACASVLVLVKGWRLRLILGAALLSVGWMLHATTGFELLFFVLLPTVLHVFIFTALFMFQGALRAKSLSGFLSVALLLLGAIYIFLVPPSVPSQTLSSFAYLHGYYFDGVRDAVLGVLGISFSWNTWVAVSGFLSFAYLYHYLNWFSKTKVIGWHAISIKRASLIIVGSLCAVALYLYDYALGFSALIIISLLHVILEFPLNVVTIKSIGHSLYAELRSRRVG